MKLTVFNTETLVKKSTTNTPPRISFGKNGAIVINSKAAETIGLHPGDTISLAQNPDEPADWYLFKDPKGYPLRGKGDDPKNGLTFNHTTLKNTFLESFCLDINETWSFEISKDPLVVKGDKTKYYFIKVVVPESETAVD